MWHFQLQALSSHKHFLLRLTAVSFVGHLILLSAVLMKNQREQVHVISLHKTEAHVKFVPTLDASKIAHSASASKKTAKTAAFSPHSLKTQPSKNVVKKEANKPLKGAGIYSATSVPSTVKQSPKTKKAAVQSKKILPKKQTAPDKIVTTTTQNNKQSSVSRAITHNFTPDFNQNFSVKQVIGKSVKMPEIIKPELKLPTSSISLPSGSEQQLPVDHAVTENIHEEVVYVLPSEYSALMTQQDLYNALHVAWNPPPGVKQGTTAQVTITVNKKGEIISTIFKKSSGMLVFDASVEDALAHVILPQSVWSKTLTITFSP